MHLLNGMIPGIQYLASSGKRMECQSKAQNEQSLKDILNIRIFDIFLGREELHFLYFSSCICVRHTLKENFFFGNKRASISHEKALKMIKMLLLKL